MSLNLFDSVKNEIETLLKKRKFTRSFTQKVGSLVRAKTDAHTSQLESLLETVDAKKEEVKPTTRVGKNPYSSKLFSLRKIGDKVAFVQDGKGVVLQLTAESKAAAIPFEKIKDTVKKDWTYHAAEQALKKALDKVKAESIKKGTLTVPAEYAKVATTDWLESSSEEGLKPFQEKGITFNFLLLDQKGAFYTQIGNKDGYIFEYDQTKKVKKEEKEEALEKIRAQLAKEFRSLTKESYQAHLQRTAQVKINEHATTPQGM